MEKKTMLVECKYKAWMSAPIYQNNQNQMNQMNHIDHKSSIHIEKPIKIEKSLGDWMLIGFIIFAMVYVFVGFYKMARDCV